MWLSWNREAELVKNKVNTTSETFLFVNDAYIYYTAPPPPPPSVCISHYQLSMHLKTSWTDKDTDGAGDPDLL